MTNPAPSVISDPLWRLWTGFRAIERTALLGGIYADKRGYHSTRADNLRQWPGDYSIRLPADLLGPADRAAALDLTLPDVRMRVHTGRLARAAQARDPRLYRDGVPVLREFIGTLDGVRVYCYDLAARVEDWTRDATHLWHIHLSVHRRWVGSWDALSGVLSVLADEPLADWERRDTVIIGLKAGDSGNAVRELQSLLELAGFSPGEIDGAYGDKTSAAVLACRKARRSSATSGASIDHWAYRQILVTGWERYGKLGARGPAGPAGAPGPAVDTAAVQAAVDNWFAVPSNRAKLQGPQGKPGPAPTKVAILGTVVEVAAQTDAE